MTKNEMQQLINSIMFSEVEFGIQMFVYLRNNGEDTIKRFRATDKLLKSIKLKITDTVRERYIHSDVEYDSAENIADNRKSLYEIIQDSNYEPFSSLNQVDDCNIYYSEEDNKMLMGFLFRINLNDDFFWIYQHVYSFLHIEKSNHVLAIIVKDAYDELKHNIVNISSKVDIIIIGNSIITSEINLIQRFFGFEHYVRTEAQNTIDIISSKDIVNGLEKFTKLKDKKQLTDAKKLLKAKNSRVLMMEKEILFERLRNHSRYRTIFKIENDHIIISSQKDACAFIKMLNDDIVRSELTGIEYDSSSKTALEPIDEGT